MKKRMWMAACGLLLVSVSVGMLKATELGMDPFQIMVAGVNEVLPFSFGTNSLLVNAALLIFTLIYDRHYIGPGTWFTIFLQGYVIDASRRLTVSLFPNPGLPGRCVIFSAAFLLICFASALYYTADMGVSSYDSFSLIGAGKLHWASFATVRRGADIGCLLFGGSLLFLVGGLSVLKASVGIGTIVIALLMGPVVQWFRRHVVEERPSGKVLRKA